MRNSYMTARSLFDTYYKIGYTAAEAFLQCMEQGIFSDEEMDELMETLNKGIYR